MNNDIYANNVIWGVRGYSNEKSGKTFYSRPRLVNVIETNAFLIYTRHPKAHSAILHCHGYYFQHGGPLYSQTTTIPAGMNLAFRAQRNQVSTGYPMSISNWLASFVKPLSLQGLEKIQIENGPHIPNQGWFRTNISEIGRSGESVTDYMLQSAEFIDERPDLAPFPGYSCDIIVPKPGRFVTLRQALSLRDKYRRSWTTLYCSFCRAPY